MIAFQSWRVLRGDAAAALIQLARSDVPGKSSLPKGGGIDSFYHGSWIKICDHALRGGVSTRGRRRVRAAAKKEGRISIFAATALSQAEAALDAFAKKHPRIIDYDDIGANAAATRIISEAAAGHGGGEVVRTSVRVTKANAPHQGPQPGSERKG
ncbi:hypothetical protein [Ensifer sp. LCM 4579]|uniref:hypothetical protein n=1 Tax=Ensifer sp. LCM 4579 TaxID=1848292 RepID=UPI0008D98793|nr:hypothetical protein [Ensifer sp. LCM 4579]OHV78060.1 hypothetical protein LCM4579_06890 [Ensifer sp. LCM 4579]